MKKTLLIFLAVFFCLASQIFAQIPTDVLVQISKAEDELRFDNTLENLMKSPNAAIRARAALASGRTGKEAAIPALTALLENDSDAKVRAAAAFAVGEIESIAGADVILRGLKTTDVAPETRARLLEAAGKIAAAAPPAEKKKSEELGAAILTVLDDEGVKPRPDRQTVLLGITAILRAKPDNGEFIAAKFLTGSEARVRADAANTLSRLRVKNANAVLREMLFKDADPIARANAARALGAAEDAGALDLLIGTAINDQDSRVRVSSIRSLASLKNAKAADRLLERAEILFADYKKAKLANPNEKSELLEIAATLGRILPDSNNQKTTDFLTAFHNLDKISSPEIEIALARVSPSNYLKISETIEVGKKTDFRFPKNKVAFPGWQKLSAVAAGLGELSNAAQQKAEAQKRLLFLVEQTDKITISYPDILRAYANFKTADLPTILRRNLQHDDVFVRATAAELLGEQPQSKETFEALKMAFGEVVSLPPASDEKKYNDAQLAIITALAKQDKEKEELQKLIPMALQHPSILIRRHTANVMKQYDLEKETPVRLGVTYVDKVLPYAPKKRTKLGQILNTNADYVRAVSRRTASAILTTEKGSFTIEFFPEAAPLTVDNFIKLARAKYFDGLAIHRVVPNFVMQDGDPRGDGNGGPGWDIRDEINTISFERGTVGMALSGKDTGGSQWFVCHSPQPHLDGGYTVFGRVNETDMKIVDNLARGDKISSVKIVEGNSSVKKGK